MTTDRDLAPTVLCCTDIDDGGGCCGGDVGCC